MKFAGKQLMLVAALCAGVALNAVGRDAEEEREDDR